MKTFPCKLSSLVLFTLFAFATTPSAVARAAQSAQRIQSETAIITFDLVYLKSANGPVDVTHSLYTSQGQTYAVLNNAAVPILVDTTSGNVYSSSGSVIGYTVHVVQQ